MNATITDLYNLNSATELAAREAVAEIVYSLLPQDAQLALGTEDYFGERVTKVDIVRSAVLAAERDGMPYKYGTTAKLLFSRGGRQN